MEECQTCHRGYDPADPIPHRVNLGHDPVPAGRWDQSHRRAVTEDPLHRPTRTAEILAAVDAFVNDHGPVAWVSWAEHDVIPDQLRAILLAWETEGRPS